MACSTFPKRGKSLTPVSRMEIEEERREIEDWREETQRGRGWVIGWFLVRRKCN